MKKTFWLGLLVTGLLLLPQAAYAMLIQGTVTQLNLDASAITLSRTDPQTQVTEELDITVLPEAEFKGISSLAELEVGDEIRVEASENEATGQLEASTVEPSESEEAAVSEQPAPPAEDAEMKADDESAPAQL